MPTFAASCIQASVFTLGCPAIHSQRRHADAVTAVRILLALVVAFAAAATPADVLAGRLASATDPTFLLLEK